LHATHVFVIATQQLIKAWHVWVRQAYPFEITGCDYAGPLRPTVHKGRNSRSEYGYICLFDYKVTSAIHLELATDLSSETCASSNYIQSIFRGKSLLPVIRRRVAGEFPSRHRRVKKFHPTSQRAKGWTLLSKFTEIMAPPLLQKNA